MMKYYTTTNGNTIPPLLGAILVLDLEFHAKQEDTKETPPWTTICRKSKSIRNGRTVDIPNGKPYKCALNINTTVPRPKHSKTPLPKIECTVPIKKTTQQVKIKRERINEKAEKDYVPVSHIKR